MLISMAHSLHCLHVMNYPNQMIDVSDIRSIEMRRPSEPLSVSRLRQWSEIKRCGNEKFVYSSSRRSADKFPYLDIGHRT